MVDVLGVLIPLEGSGNKRNTSTPVCEIANALRGRASCFADLPIKQSDSRPDEFVSVGCVRSKRQMAYAIVRGAAWRDAEHVVTKLNNFDSGTAPVLTA